METKAVKPKKLKKGDNLTIIGKRWFDKINGNTYHSVKVYINGVFIAEHGMTYGYGDQYTQTARELIKDYLPSKMDEHTPLHYLREYGITIINEVSDVARKRDL